MLVLALTLVQVASGQNHERSPSRVLGWSWMKEAWTGDDGPYRKTRQTILQRMSKEAKPEQLVAEYKAIALRSPSNPQAQFAWAFAAYEASARLKDPNTIWSMTNEVLFPLAKAPSPKAYEYARLRFMLEAYKAPLLELIPVGRRLLKRRPNDLTVKYFLAKLLGWSKSQSDKLLAANYAEQLRQAYPNNARYSSLLGGVHLELWLMTRQAQHAKKAIASYEKSLQLKQAKGENVDWLRHLIKFTQDDLAKHQDR